MEEECRFGLMDQDTMDSGEMALLMGTVGWSMQKVMFMKENGLKIKQMDLAFILISTVQDMKVNGSKTSNMVMVLSNGQMVPSLKVNMSKE